MSLPKKLKSFSSNKSRSSLSVLGYKDKLLFGIFPLIVFFGSTVLSLALFLFGNPKAGVDFSGGVVINFHSSSRIDSSNLDDIVNHFGKVVGTKSFSMQNNNSGDFSIRFGNKINDDDIGNANDLVDIFKSGIVKVFDNVVFDNIDSIGPQVSKGLVSQSVIAMLFSMLAIIIYLFIQFNIYFAVSGVVVLLCDILISVGFVIVCGFEFNLTLIAAFLTLIGYCVNDTVVLYDRIRSNLRTANTDMFTVFKHSVIEVLRRSLTTSIVTIIGVSGILFFSDEAIVNFAWTVIFGIVIGTFGSIYIAPSLPLLFNFKVKKKKVVARDKMFYAS
ncbi:MAG: protein translocase subunit SecF [Alphaproteobacteria bacterium]|nr:protein translocase subunit SecF [Rickettsiales bacterium]